MNLTDLSFLDQPRVSTPSKKEKVFPIVNGQVKVSIDGKTFAFQSRPNVFIHDACEVNGTRIRSIKGLGWDSLIQGIYTEVYSAESADSRMATCIYLNQLQQGINAGMQWIQTIFGLKYIYSTKEPVQAKPNVSWDNFN